MKLLDLVCLLSDMSCLLDLYQPVGDDEEFIWTGQAWDIPDELHDRIVGEIEVSASGLNIDLL